MLSKHQPQPDLSKETLPKLPPAFSVLPHKKELESIRENIEKRVMIRVSDRLDEHEFENARALSTILFILNDEFRKTISSYE